MSDLHHAFGTVVRRRRAEAGFSQEELAEQAGVHRTYVSAIERGKVRLGLEAAKRIAIGLNTPLGSLVDEAETLLQEEQRGVQSEAYR